MNFKGMRRAFALSAAAALSLSLVGCGSSPSSDTKGAPSSTPSQSTPAPANTSKDPIKLGAVFILSGASAGYGTSQKAGMEIALAEINAAGGVGGHPLQIQYEDSAGDANKAINAVQKLINQDNVLAIIGPTLSTEMLAAGPVAQQNGVPIMGVSTTAKGITEIGNYVFRNSLPEASVLPTVVQVAKSKLNVTKAALLFDNQDTVSTSGADTFKAALQKESISIVDTETFGTKDNDFAAQIDKALAAKPEAVFISSLYPAGSQVLLQLRSKGYSGPIFGGNGFNSPKVFEIANNAAEGLVVGSPWFSGATTPEATKFVDAYKKANGDKLPDQFAAQAYDGLKLMAMAIGKANTTTNRDKVRDALAGITDYVGATGKFAFDANRNPVQSPFVLQIKGGKYVELK